MVQRGQELHGPADTPGHRRVPIRGTIGFALATGNRVASAECTGVAVALSGDPRNVAQQVNTSISSGISRRPPGATARWFGPPLC